MNTEGARRRLVIKRIHQEGRDIRAFDMLPETSGAAPSSQTSGTDERADAMAPADETAAGAGAPRASGGGRLASVGEHGVSFVPGQVALLTVGDERPGYFALASAPEDEELEFLIKRAEFGVARLLYEMRPGDAVELAGLAGRGFPMDGHRGKDLVFVAMGTGVAPLRSALRHALARPGEFGRVFVLYGARTPEDFCYRDEWDGWRAAGVDLRQVISRPDGFEWSGPTGYVQSLLDHVLPALSDPVALVCGSPRMIEQTRARLSEMGFAPEAILTNY